MRRISKKTSLRKIGFTLLEMVLVLAIICMMSFYLFSTFKVVNYSHLKVAVVNDMHDFASLNLQAISNALCNSTTVSSGSNIKVDSSGDFVVLNGSNILPGYVQYHVGGTQAKWGVTLKITTIPDSRVVRVAIELTDRAQPASGVAYHDEVFVYCPGCVEMEAMTDVASVGFSTDPVEEE